MIQDESGHGINRRAVVAREHNRFTPIGEDKAPGILRLMLGTIKALQLQPARPQAPEARLFKPHDAPGCLDVRTDVQPLRKP